MDPIFYKDLVTPDNSITNLITQLQDLIKVYGDAKQKIQGEAQQVAKAIENVSSATEEQRKQIQLATEQSEKLAKSYRDVTAAEFEVIKSQIELKNATKQQKDIDKLIVQINNSAEGSYNRLSAQYRLNKIRLNELSAEQRATVPQYKALEEETRNIYEEMKRLQEVTGKNTLNVGNYGDATKNLRGELMQLVQQMAQMKAEGKDNTAEYDQMRQRAGKLQDAMMDARMEIRNTANDTKDLNTIMNGIAIGGGLMTMTKQLGLFSSSNEDANASQQGLQKTIAVVSALIMLQNALQKQSNLMIGVGAVKTWALAMAEKVRAKFTTQSAIATKGATIAQKAFNVVASANPYVLLAMALVSVIGAITLFAIGTNKAHKEQKQLNDLIASNLEYMEAHSERISRLNNERASQLQRDLDVAKAQNKSLSDQRKIEDDIYNERVSAHDKKMKIYSIEMAKEDEYRAKLEKLQDNLRKLQQAQAKGYNRINIDVNLDGKLERVKVEQAIEDTQKSIDNYGKIVTIATELRTEGADIEKERALQIAQRIKDAKDQAKVEQDIVRQSEDKRLANIKDSYTRERMMIEANAKREIEDINKRLAEEVNLTAKARESLRARIVDIETKKNRDLAQLSNQYILTNRNAIRETEDLQLELMQEGEEKQILALQLAYERKRQDLEASLKIDGTLTTRQRAEINSQILLLEEKHQKDLKELNDKFSVERLTREEEEIQLRLSAVKQGSQEEVDLTIELLRKQRDKEIAENDKKAEAVRQSQADIEKKWNAKILQTSAEMNIQRATTQLQQLSELNNSEIDLMQANERQKTQLRLQAERERLQAILDINRKFGGTMTKEQIATIENQIKAIGRASSRTPFSNLYEVLGIGLNQEQQQAMTTAINETMNNVSELINLWVQEAEAAVQAAEKKVSAAQSALDAEIEARNNGYANNVVQAQKELELQKQQQAKAVEEKKKAQKVQLALDTITQASSLITASANIWASLSPIPIVGPALALAMISTMWGSFAGAKIKAIQMTSQSEEYGDGTVELLQGGSHASGHDIDLGRKADGTRRRAEGGEYFAVINKRNSRKYGSLIPDVINAFNNGTFADKYQRAGSDISSMSVSMGSDLSGLESGVEAIRKQGETTRYIDGNGNVVECYKNVKRRILKC